MYFCGAASPHTRKEAFRASPESHATAGTQAKAIYSKKCRAHERSIAWLGKSIAYIHTSDVLYDLAPRTDLHVPVQPPTNVGAVQRASMRHRVPHVVRAGGSGTFRCTRRWLQHHASHLHASLCPLCRFMVHCYPQKKHHAATDESIYMRES